MTILQRFKAFLGVVRVFLDKRRLSGLVYATFRSYCRIRQRVVLLESHHGRAFTGNPYYIAKHLLQTPKYKDFRLVIVANRKAKSIAKTLPCDLRVTFCSEHSIKYCYWLAVAEFLINNATFPVYFSRRNGQKYLNTWHGTPLKTLGRKIAHNPFELSNCQRNFLHSTHILFPNEHTEKVIKKHYMIEHIWSGKTLRSGYPRNSVFFSQVSYQKNMRGSNQVNVAYMPTWRGSLKDLKITAKSEMKRYLRLFNFLENNLPECVRLWVNLHPLIQDEINLLQFKRISQFPNTMEPYEFLSRCDVLVTDYSSVMFDFSVTLRPIILFMEDKCEYEKERGFCLNPDLLPFPRVESPTDLVRKIVRILDQRFEASSAYKDFVTKYCPHDSDRSTENLCSSFFEGSRKSCKKIVKSQNAKRNVLIFVGSFQKNGITSSLKNLVDNLDKDLYNIFLWIDRKAGEKRGKEYFSKLDSRINYIVTEHFLSAGIPDNINYLGNYLLSSGFSLEDSRFSRVLKQEYHRMFGSSRFDTIIHFSGYDSRPALLMCVSDAKKVIYMHNDMVLEERTKRNYDLRAIKLAYQEADWIATVREGLEYSYCAEVVNISNKTRFVPNCVSKRYNDLQKEDLLNALSDASRKTFGKQVLKALSKPRVFRFINVARFSHEKGQIRLIEAFETVSEQHPNSQLYILGGYGDFFKNVLKRRCLSPAATNIFVLEGSDNPFPLFSKMDALVMASFYEGLSLVVLESLALGIPVISTDVPGLSDILKDGYGLIVDNSVGGLVEGMLAAIKGELPRKPFDLDEYNKVALQKFYSIID